MWNDLVYRKWSNHILFFVPRASRICFISIITILNISEQIKLQRYCKKLISACENQSPRIYWKLYEVHCLFETVRKDRGIYAQYIQGKSIFQNSIYRPFQPCGQNVCVKKIYTFNCRCVYQICKTIRNKENNISSETILKDYFNAYNRSKISISDQVISKEFEVMKEL